MALLLDLSGSLLKIFNHYIAPGALGFEPVEIAEMADGCSVDKNKIPREFNAGCFVPVLRT
jgi:hypothetical protein